MLDFSQKIAAKLHVKKIWEYFFVDPIPRRFFAFELFYCNEEKSFSATRRGFTFLSMVEEVERFKRAIFIGILGGLPLH